MERKFTLVLSLLIVSWFCSFAAAPTVSPSNLEYTTIEGDKLTLRFRKGDGAFRIVVLKEGAAVTTLPVNGVDYTPSAAFGASVSAFNTNDGYVVYESGSAATLISVPVTNLKPATTYYIAVFEFNGSGTNTEYYTVALTGSKATLSVPTSQASFKQATNIIGNSVTLNWNLGNGERRLVLARKGSAVNAVPEDLKSYSGNSDFGEGNVINGDNYVVYSGSANTSIAVNNLEPNTTYHFAIFDYNGSSGPVYLKPGAIYTVTTNAGPTRASGAISFPTVDGNRLSMSFSKGNGKHQLIIGRKGAAITAVPVNGQLYEADPVFGQGFEIAPGQFVLNSLENDRNFTSLDPYAVYHFRIYEFDIDANGNTYYLTGSYSQGSSPTAVAPATQVSAINVETITGSSFTIKYTAGDSKYRLIVVKAGSAVDAAPVDLTRYDGGSPIYGQGRQVTPGNYIISGQTNSNGASVSGLTPGVTYHVAIWGWNGLDYPIYKQDPARKEITIPNEPSAAATNYSTGTIEGNSFFNSWNGGDGGRRLVIARKGAAVTARPLDGQTYTADNDFGEGTAIEDGQFVVHDATTRGFTIKKLEAGSTYHFAVFEYNVTNNLPDYRVSTFLAAQGATLAAPTAQASISSVDQVQANSARINFAKGNGSYRLFVMRANAPVNAMPQDFEDYSSSGMFGIGDHLGNGNYVVATSSSVTPVTVQGLTPNTVYYVAVFEYNGNTAPVYLRPGADYQFTTIPGGSTVPPTINASDPSFIVDGNKLTFNFDKGDGARRIVVMKQGSGISFQPADGTDYTANPAFSQGADLGGGQYVVYNGTQQEAAITTLQPSVNYSLAVFEYNGTGSTTRYLIAGALSVQQSTALAPAEGSSGMSSQATSASVTLNWQQGDGDGRLVVLKEGGAISGQPANLSKYPSSAQFRQGAQIATGEYVVYAGAASSVVITGLDPAKIYHFSVFEYNGVDAPVYNKTNVLTGQASTTGALPLTWVYFSIKEKRVGVELKWGTTDEVNTAYFIIERSAGNEPFISLDTVAALNTPGDLDYSYNDFSAPAKMVQYRIKQVDIDGEFTYSRALHLNLSAAKDELRLYPNPVVGSFRMVLPAGVNRGNVMIYDVSGKMVVNKLVNSGEVIEVGRLVKGIYSVVVIDGEKRYLERLVKQ